MDIGTVYGGDDRGEADERAGESTQAAVPRALPAMLRDKPTARGTSHRAALESRAKLFGSSGGRRKSSCGPRAGFCKELAPRSCGASLLPIKTLGSPRDAAGRADLVGEPTYDEPRDVHRAGVRWSGAGMRFHPRSGCSHVAIKMVGSPRDAAGPAGNRIDICSTSFLTLGSPRDAAGRAGNPRHMQL